MPYYAHVEHGSYLIANRKKMETITLRIKGEHQKVFSSSK